MKIVIIAALAATLMITPMAQASNGGCNQKKCVERVAMRFCSHGRIVSCIHRGALRWDVSFPMLRRKAWCETGGTFSPFSRNPHPVHGEHASGLFQFLPSTWRSTPYASHSIWSAKWSSLAAGWMHAVGRGGEWDCT